MHQLRSFASRHELQAVPQEKRQSAGSDPGDDARRDAERLRERHAEIKGQRRGEWHQRHRREKTCHAMHPYGVMTFFGHTVEGRGHEQQRERDQQRRQRQPQQSPRVPRQMLESGAEGAMELEPQQDLRAEHEHARLVQRVPDLVLERRHGADSERLSATGRSCHGRAGVAV
jgi:hypothetical protein